MGLACWFLPFLVFCFGSLYLYAGFGFLVSSWLVFCVVSGLWVLLPLYWAFLGFGFRVSYWGVFIILMYWGS